MASAPRGGERRSGTECLPRVRPTLLADVALERLGDALLKAGRLENPYPTAAGTEEAAMPLKPQEPHSALREGTPGAPGLLADVALERLQVVVVALRVARVVRTQVL